MVARGQMPYRWQIPKKSKKLVMTPDKKTKPYVKSETRELLRMSKKGKEG